MSDRTVPPPALAAALELIAPQLELVERAMREQLRADHALVGAIGEHVLSSGGKRLRPVLLMLCAELCGYAHYQMQGMLHVLPQEQYDAWQEEASRIALAMSLYRLA